MENLYKILKCNETASHQELKKSYQTLVLKCHPDKSHTGHRDSEEFIKINRAWTVLSDPAVREQYDLRWKERCLAQAYPIQDTVDFDDFENNEVDTLNINDCEEKLSKTVFNCGISAGTEGQGLEISNNIPLQNKSSCCGEKDWNVGKESKNTDEMEASVFAAGENEDIEDSKGLPPLSEDDTIYTYNCRCGGSYVLTGVDVKLRFDIVCCDTCSLSIQVVYDNKDEETL